MFLRWCAGDVARGLSRGFDTTASRSTGCSFTSSLPAAMRDMSSRSSISCTCACGVALEHVHGAVVVAIWSSAPCCSSQIEPLTALSGVRSSCDTIARNSSLVRLARSASRARPLAGQRARERSFGVAHAQQRADGGQQHRRADGSVRYMSAPVSRPCARSCSVTAVCDICSTWMPGVLDSALELPADLEAAHVRQIDVEHDQVGRCAPRRGKRLRARAGLDHLVSRRGAGSRLDEPGRVVVVDDQDARGVIGCSDVTAAPCAAPARLDSALRSAVQRCSRVSVGLGQHGGGPAPSRSRSASVERPGRDDDDRDPAGARIALQRLAAPRGRPCRRSCRSRQHDVRVLALRLPQRRRAAGRLDDLVIARRAACRGR